MLLLLIDGVSEHFNNQKQFHVFTCSSHPWHVGGGEGWSGLWRSYFLSFRLIRSILSEMSHCQFFVFFPVEIKMKRSQMWRENNLWVAASEHCLNSCVPSAFLKGVCVWPVIAPRFLSVARPLECILLQRVGHRGFLRSCLISQSCAKEINPTLAPLTLWRIWVAVTITALCVQPYLSLKLKRPLLLSLFLNIWVVE